MKNYIAFLFVFLTFSSWAFARAIHIKENSACSSTIERNQIQSLTQKSKLKKCAKEGAQENAIHKCEYTNRGEVINIETSLIGCESQIVWGGRNMVCSYEATVKCEIF